MNFPRKCTITALAVTVLTISLAAAQDRAGLTRTHPAHGSLRKTPLTLTPDDGLSIIAAALDSHVRSGSQHDCSHLVHAIYDRAGFSYPYASSAELYRGNSQFRLITHPQPGDLVVWSGHVGIVVNPAQCIFFSFLRNGPGIDTYDAGYWKQRGPARFYRYIKVGQHRV